MATRESPGIARGWKVVACIASGPSLTQEQADLIAAAHSSGACRVITVNDTWRMVPTADVAYAADGHWWQHHVDAVRAGFRGELWTQDIAAAQKLGLNYIKARGLPGLSRDPTLIHTGGNSGYQAINLAYHFGAQRIVLAGYDMQNTGGRHHWFGDHPTGFSQSARPEQWAPRFVPLAADLEREGVKVINATISTALDCFNRGTLDALLDPLP